MSRRVVAITILVILAAGLAVLLRARAGDHRRSGLAMAERLERIAGTADPAINIYLNDRRAERLAEALRSDLPLEQEVELRLDLAKQLIYAGRTQEAIDLLTALRERLGDLVLVAPGPAAARVDLLLMLAYLRLGEQVNCLEHHTTASCLMPIDEAGVHVRPEGSRAAMEIMLRYLRADPDNLACRWLLNLAAMTLGRYPDGVPPAFRIPPEVFASDHPLPRFTDVAGDLGLDVVSLSGGVVMDDLDGDGLLDIMVSGWGLREPMHLFRNDGDGGFTDVTASAGLDGQVGGLNLVHADYDNDGDLDVLVLRGAWLFRAGEHPNSLLANDGTGRFTDVTEAAGLLSFHPTQTAAWADFDGDGWLDLFIGNESFDGVQHPCELYRNDRDGTFTDIAAASGVDHRALVKGVAAGDYDGDGRADLFLSVYEGPNVLYRNEPGPMFRDVTAEAGVAGPASSFPAWFFDYDNDGRLDLLVAPSENWEADMLTSVVRDYLGERHDAARCALYRNRGDGTFADVAPAMDLDRVLLAMGSNYGDLDNDGWLDCYFGTGQPSMITLVPNRMFRNDAGRRFQDVTTAGGFGHVQKGHGVAFGDLDQDGDQDVYAVMGGAFSGDVYQNVLFENPGSDNAWVTLRLRGTTSNRCAIGARVRIDARTPGGPREIHRTVGSGGSFGASSLQLEVGLGDATAIAQVTVRWPGGEAQTYAGVPLRRIVTLTEGEPEPEVASARPFGLRKATHGLGHGHE